MNKPRLREIIARLGEVGTTQLERTALVDEATGIVGVTPVVPPEVADVPAFEIPQPEPAIVHFDPEVLAEPTGEPGDDAKPRGKRSSK